MLNNILSNALKYTPSGGTIFVDARCVRAGDALDSTDGVSIGLSDTGPGVPPAFRSQIFDKFFRVEHQLGDGRPHARGAGIGLYMCRQIVELHGGAITCDAGTDGRGTCITLTLLAGIPPNAAVVSDAAVYVDQ